MPRAATPFFAASPCGVQLCERIKAGKLKLVAPQQAGQSYSELLNHQSIQRTYAFFGYGFMLTCFFTVISMTPWFGVNGP